MSKRVGGRGGWGTEGGLYHTFELHKQSQYTCQAETVADCSLTPSVALLECPRGTVCSIVDHHDFTRSQNDSSESRSDICSSVIDVFGQCMSVAFMLGQLDFSSCGIAPGFCKSSRICTYVAIFNLI